VIFVESKSKVLTAKGIISVFRKRAVDGLYLQPRKYKVLQIEFDTGGLMKVRIGYTGLICNDFGLLDS
jgi:hypothetical protein